MKSPTNTVVAPEFKVALETVTPRAELTILKCARVSSATPDSEKPGLIGYLIRNNHWSPFEMGHMLFEVQTSRTIAHQILRHRSFAFQEFSQRYAIAPEICVYQARIQAENNRQSSVDEADAETAEWFIETQHVIGEISAAKYHEGLDRGIAREQARFLLPESTRTTLYMVGSIRSWIHYLALRTEEHAQQEHREIAEAIKSIFVQQLPIISEALWGSSGVETIKAEKERVYKLWLEIQEAISGSSLASDGWEMIQAAIRDDD